MGGSHLGGLETMPRVHFRDDPIVWFVGSVALGFCFPKLVLVLGLVFAYDIHSFRTFFFLPRSVTHT
jgi:hypothetical protein